MAIDALPETPSAGLANVYWDRGDTASASTEGKEAIALLQDAGPCVELAYALGFVAFNAWTAGRPDEALRWAEQLVVVADMMDADEIRGLALMERGQARLDLDDPQGLDDEIAAVAATNAALEHGNTGIQSSWQLLNWQSNLAEALWLAEGTPAALAATQEAQRNAERRGLHHPLRAVRADGTKSALRRWEVGRPPARSDRGVRLGRMRRRRLLASRRGHQFCPCAAATRAGVACR